MAGLLIFLAVYTSDDSYQLSRSGNVTVLDSKLNPVDDTLVPDNNDDTSVAEPVDDSSTTPSDQNLVASTETATPAYGRALLNT